MEGSFTLALAGPCAWGDTLGGLWVRNRTTLILSVMHTTSQCMVLPTYHNGREGGYGLGSGLVHSEVTLLSERDQYSYSYRTYAILL